MAVSAAPRDAFGFRSKIDARVKRFGPTAKERRMPLFLRRFGRGLRRLRRRRRSVDGHHGLRRSGRCIHSGVCGGGLTRASRRGLRRRGVTRDRARRDARIERRGSGRRERRSLDGVARGFRAACEREASEDQRRPREARREIRRSVVRTGPKGEVDPTERTRHVRRANVARTRGTGRKGHETEAISVPPTTHQVEGVPFGILKAR
jgi:hypothetical protein